MWSKWRDLTDSNLNTNWTQSPGIYFIRLVNQRGTPAKIPRIIGVDKRGILYIGMATTGHDGGLCNRLWGFENYHSAGRKYRHLLCKHFPDCHLQYRHRTVQKGKQAKRLETEYLRRYQRRWGELPPLNRAGAE
jgi:hypothetical protein